MPIAPRPAPSRVPAYGLDETIRMLTGRMPGTRPTPVPSRLEACAVVPNPGNLRFWRYRPPALLPGAPLVVALHGCGQTAAAFDAGTGWSVLADRLGFALLFPEQQAANNAHTCFNWFDPGDASRDRGELGSVATAVTQAVAQDGLDRRRVFVTGLSAGGALAAALLSCRPDLFAAGAVIAGLPFGSANTMRDALDAMFRGHTHPADEWGQRVRNAAPPGFPGPWPRISVWHGTGDSTVRPVNAGESVKQWLDVHGLAGLGRPEPMTGATRTVWRDRAGRAVVEQVTVPGLGHGVPVSPGTSGVGVPGPYILRSEVSSTEEIARFFGLVPSTPAMEAPAPGVAGLLGRLLRAGLDPLRLALNARS